MKQSRALAAMFLRRITASGIKEAEIYHTASDRLEVNGHECRITGLNRSSSEGIAVRVCIDGKIGSSYTENVSKEGVDHALMLAQQQIPILPPDPDNVLYPGSRVSFTPWEDLHQLASVPIEAKKDLVIKLEEAARALDKRIVHVPQVRYLESHDTVTVVNSYGMKKSEQRGYCAAALHTAAGKGKQVQSWKVTAADTSFYELSALRIAQEAVLGVLEKLNPQGIDSGEYPVVFSQDAASKLLGAFFNSPYSHIFGDQVKQGRSRFAGHIGRRAASEAVTIYDNPRGSSLFSRSFDDEGFPTKNTMFIFEGILKGFAHSMYSARHFKTSPTGHGMRGGASLSVSTGLHAPCLSNGEHELEDLFDLCGKGVYITELGGLHAGINPMTGDFSLSAGGFHIEKGKQKKSVGRCIVSGNFFDLLTMVQAAAGDRRMDRLLRFSSPSLLVSKLSVSG